MADMKSQGYFKIGETILRKFFDYSQKNPLVLEKESKIAKYTFNYVYEHGKHPPIVEFEFGFNFEY